MGFFDKLKKSKGDVPSELPDLAVNDIKSKVNEGNASLEKFPEFKAVSEEKDYKMGLDDVEESAKYSRGRGKAPEDREAIFIEGEDDEKFTGKKWNKEGADAEKKIKEYLNDDEKSFFKDLLRNVTEESKSVESLDEWYNREFVSRDIVNQMRDYWEKQKPELVMKYVGNEMKEKLLKKTNKLHDLEIEWQKIYFDLMKKEEEIRQEEKELKGELSEFVKLCKKHLGKGSKESGNTGKKK